MEDKKAYMIIYTEKLVIDTVNKTIEFEGEVSEYDSLTVDGKIAYENEDYFSSLLKKTDALGRKKLSIKSNYQSLRLQEDKFLRFSFMIFEDFILFES